MRLTPSERDRLLIFTTAELARRRQARGLRLNVPEAFLLDQLARDEYAVTSALLAMATRHVRPPRSPAALAQAFASGQFIPRFGAAVLDRV